MALMVYAHPMSPLRDPQMYRFETAEAEARYDAWLQSKVAASLADPRPSIPHEEVVVEMESLLAQIETEKRRDI